MLIYFYKNKFMAWKEKYIDLFPSKLFMCHTKIFTYLSERKTN